MGMKEAHCIDNDVKNEHFKTHQSIAKKEL